MKILSTVAALGAGKTTFVFNVLKKLNQLGLITEQNKFAFVINDEGTLVDGALAQTYAEVKSMINGCFTCKDTQELKRTLENLEKSGFTWVFLEGFGMTPGGEIRQFLKTCPYPFHILTLLSARDHKKDIVRYADIIKSHVTSATLAIGITKCTEGDWDHQQVLDFVTEHKQGIPTCVVTNSTEVPNCILDFFTTQRSGIQEFNFSFFSKEHHHCSDHGCSKHTHHNIHNTFPYHHKLEEGTTLKQIKNAFEGKEFVLRIKGAVEGHLFNEVHGIWEQTVQDSRNFVTFYTTRQISLNDDLPELAHLIVTDKEKEEKERPGYELIRREISSREETVTEIQKLLQEIPATPILVERGADRVSIITHPEKLQLLKEISRRPSVKDEWFPVVLKECMMYWIKCAQAIEGQIADITPHELPVNLYELGVSMVWWTNRFKDFFGQEIVSDVEDMNPGMMVAEGILSLKNLNPEPTLAYWQCKEFTEALSYGLEHSGNSKLILQAARRCLELSRSESPELLQFWTESVETLKEQIGGV